MAYEWVSQRLLSKVTDTASIYSNTDKNGFGWWFAYFWKEVGTSGRDEDLLKSIVGRVFAAQFPANVAALNYGQQRAAGDLVATNFTAPLPEPANLMANALQYRQLLTDVLRLGFRGMPMAAKLTDPTRDTHEERRAELARMFADRMEASKVGAMVPLALAYRGETRPFQKVIEHNGALSRADLGLLNMNKPWHPFSDPVVAAEVYARGASGDNCLYTVLSVASEVEIPAGFPLIEDANIYKLPEPAPADLSGWNHKMFRDTVPLPDSDHLPVLFAKCRITGIPNKTLGIFLASDSYIYVVKVRKAAFTQDFVEQEFSMPQNQCKERGVRGVRLKNFLAGARVRRIHLGPARMCGTVAFVQEVKYLQNRAWVSTPDLATYAAEHFYGDQAAAGAALNLIAQRLGPAVGGQRIVGEVNGTMAPNPNPTIQAIEQWNLTFNQFNAYKDNQLNALYWGKTAM